MRLGPIGLWAGLGLAASPAALAAQGDCFPPKDSHEAQTLGIFSVPLAFSNSGIGTAGGSRVQVGVELSYLPNVDPVLATPTTCRPNKGPENTDLMFAAPRPRVGLALGHGFAVEASWVPPVRLGEVKANLFGLSLSWDHRVARETTLRLRGHGTFGRINAPITCDDDALLDSASECYQGTRSDDRLKPNIVGADATVYWSLGRGRAYPYLGFGYNHLMPRFQVDFTNAQGQTDRRKVEVDLDRLAMFGGLTWMAGRRLSLSGEVYSAPSDAVTGRVAVRLGLGR